MNRLCSPIVLCLLAIGTIARAEDWRDHVPEGWLATLEIRDPGSFDRFYRKLHRPSSPPWALEGLLDTFGLATDQPLALVAIEPAESGEEPQWLLLVPAGDFDNFCKQIGANQAEGLAVFKFFTDLAATRAGAWIAITKLETADLLLAPKDPPPTRCAESNSVAMISPGGLRLLRDESLKRPRPKRRGRRGPAWPTNALQVMELLWEHQPVLEALAKQDRLLAVGLSDSETEPPRLTIEWDLPMVAAESLARPLDLDDGIATLALAGSVPSPIIDLLLATIESAPDSLIEANEFPAEPWHGFAGATRSLLDRVESPTLLLTSPGRDEPIAANQSATFAWKGEASELGEALLAAVTRWNQMTQATKARAPINAVLTSMPEAGGWRIRLNLLSPGDRDPIPEVQAVFKRYYGHEHGAQIDVVPTEGGRWLATFAAPGNHPELSPTADQPGALATGSLRVDRWIAWERLQRLAAQGREETDTKPVPPAPPAELRLFSQEGRTLLEATLPWEALRLAYPVRPEKSIRGKMGKDE